MKDAVLESKKAVVSEIQEKMTASQSTVVVEYRGLTVAEVTELRRSLRAEGIEFKVYKNSMSQRAAEAAGFNELTEQLTGPNAIAFSDDAVALEKKLHEVLNDKRTNKINLRKEFFNVSIDELEVLVQEIEPTAEFNKTMVAEQYRQTLSINEEDKILI